MTGLTEHRRPGLKYVIADGNPLTMTDLLGRAGCFGARKKWLHLFAAASRAKPRAATARCWLEVLEHVRCVPERMRVTVSR